MKTRTKRAQEPAETIEPRLTTTLYICRYLDSPEEAERLAEQLVEAAAFWRSTFND